MWKIREKRNEPKIFNLPELLLGRVVTAKTPHPPTNPGNFTLEKQFDSHENIHSLPSPSVKAVFEVVRRWISANDTVLR